MTTTIQVAFGVIALILLFLPASLLIYASLRMIKTVESYSMILVAMGALLLTIVSLDFLYSFLLALAFGPEELATYALYSTYLFKGLNYLALLLISFGLLRLSKRIKTLSGREI